MKMMVCFLMLASTAVCSLATGPEDYTLCLEYLATNYPDARAPKSFAFQQEQDGSLSIVWNLPSPKPTFAQLDAVKDQALAWKSNQVAEAAANIDGMELQPKSVIRALVKVVNDRLPAGQKITEAELKAAIKAEAGK